MTGAAIYIFLSSMCVTNPSPTVFAQVSETEFRRTLNPGVCFQSARISTDSKKMDGVIL